MSTPFKEELKTFWIEYCSLAIVAVIGLCGMTLVLFASINSNSKIKECEGNGGYALTERGMFKECIKKEFILEIRK